MPSPSYKYKVNLLLSTYNLIYNNLHPLDARANYDFCGGDRNQLIFYGKIKLHDYRDAT